MSRLLVMGVDPMHLSAAEAEAWVREQSEQLLELDAVDRVDLARLTRASKAHLQSWDWLLEVYLAAHGLGASCVDEPLFADWLRDLRLLGMRPVVVLADTSREAC